MSWIALPPQWAQCPSTEVDGDDDELGAEADFDNGFCGRAVERDAGNDALRFSRLGIALAPDDFAGKDDIFEVKDTEVVIFKLFGCVG